MYLDSCPASSGSSSGSGKSGSVDGPFPEDESLPEDGAAPMERGDILNEVGEGRSAEPAEAAVVGAPVASGAPPLIGVIGVFGEAAVGAELVPLRVVGEAGGDVVPDGDVGDKKVAVRRFLVLSCLLACFLACSALYLFASPAYFFALSLIKLSTFSFISSKNSLLYNCGDFNI